jgi:hypothetical protein
MGVRKEIVLNLLLLLILLHKTTTIAKGFKAIRYCYEFVFLVCYFIYFSELLCQTEC